MNIAQIPFDIKEVSCGGEFLSDFIESYFEPAYLKDAYTGKHLLANFQMTSWCGLESIHDVIGITLQELWVQDVVQRRKRLNIDSVVVSDEIKDVEKIENLEKQIMFKKAPISIKRYILGFNGIVTFERVLKAPILNQERKKVVVLLTVFQDLTYQLHCSKIFQLYQGFYPQQKAIQKTLEHFKLEKYFHSQPTHKEMQVLLSMRDDSRYKAVAKKLECSATTVGNHIVNIQNKLVSCTLHDVLLKLPAIPENEKSTYL